MSGHGLCFRESVASSPSLPCEGWLTSCWAELVKAAVKRHLKGLGVDGYSVSVASAAIDPYFLDFMDPSFRRRRLSTTFSGDCPATHTYNVYFTSHRDRVHDKLVKYLGALAEDPTPLVDLLATHTPPPSEGDSPSTSPNTRVCGLEVASKEVRILPPMERQPSYRPQQGFAISPDVAISEKGQVAPPEVG
jgi:hypothetical protein